SGRLVVFWALAPFSVPCLGLLADFARPRLNGRLDIWPLRGAMVVAIVAGAVVLTVLAQAVVGRVDLVGVFSPDPRTAMSHLSAFPFTIPLGGLLFVIYLEVSIVSGLPLMAKRPVREWIIVLLGCPALALFLYRTLASWNGVPLAARTQLGRRNPGGTIDALDLAGIVIAITIWQVLYLFSGGGPIGALRAGRARSALANLVVIGLGLLTYWLMRSVLQFSVPQIAQLAAMVVVGVLSVGLLFGRPAAGPPATLALVPRLQRYGMVALVALLTYVVLHWVGHGLQPSWSVGSLELWITICGLNLIGGSIFLYCRILRAPSPAQ